MHWIIPTSLVATLALVLLIYVPKRQARHLTDVQGRLNLENEARKTLAQIIGGIGLMVGLGFSWQTIRASWEALDLNRQGQITDRFTRAIDQLGTKDSLETRLGGIYALDRIARESFEDHGAIVGVLTAFVRENAPWPPAGPQSAGDAATRSAVDIEAAVQTLGRRQWGNGSRHASRPMEGSTDPRRLVGTATRVRYGERGGAFSGSSFRAPNRIQFDLAQVDLPDVNLSNGHFDFALFTESRLQRSSLHRASLRSAILVRADLREADLSNADLTGAFLQEANLEEASLSGATLKYALFTGANLTDAVLVRTDLSGAQLTNVTGLTQSQLDHACAEEVHLPAPDPLDTVRRLTLPDGLLPPPVTCDEWDERSRLHMEHFARQTKRPPRAWTLPDFARDREQTTASFFAQLDAEPIDCQDAIMSIRGAVHTMCGATTVEAADIRLISERYFARGVSWRRWTEFTLESGRHGYWGRWLVEPEVFVYVYYEEGVSPRSVVVTFVEG